MNNRHSRECPGSAYCWPESIISFAMAQKITYCIVTSQWDDDEGRYVDEWHKDKLYDLDNKADVKALAVDLLNFNLQQGVKTSLKTYIERESITITANDLGIK